MESMHELLQDMTRDWDTMDLDVPKIEESASLSSHGGEHLDEVGAARAKTIQTKGLFNFMELPTEIRVKIYNLLLISPEVIDIDSDNPESFMTTPSKLPYPPVAILRTCKMIEEEATPILYGKNAFAICLPNDPKPTFLLSKFRWSTLHLISSLTFTSSNGLVPALSLTATAFSEPSFHCTGPDILARFSPSDFRYAPVRPDRFMALSISNWVSTRVMRAQMSAIQKELEAIMGPYDDVLAALQGGQQT